MKKIVTILSFVALSSAASAKIEIPKELQGKTISIVVPYPPGGQSDVWARINAAKVKEITGLDIIVVNKAGADGAVGARLVAEANADGTTMLATDNGTVVISPLFKEANYIPRTKFVTVAAGYRTPQGFYVRADSKYKTLKDLIDDAKSDPGKVNVGGPYSLAKIAINKTFDDTNGKVQVIDYKGVPPATTDLLGGHVDAIFGPPILLAQVRAGKLRSLAFSGPQRISEFSEVPVMREFIPGFVFENFSGVYAPEGTPKHIVNFWNQVYREAAKDPVAQEFLKASAAGLFDGSAADAEKFVKSSEDFWSPIVTKYHKPKE
jgi:tripartite-type tricarboxylate transporter receptor subunit TctC